VSHTGEYEEVNGKECTLPEIVSVFVKMYFCKILGKLLLAQSHLKILCVQLYILVLVSKASSFELFNQSVLKLTILIK